MVAVLLVPVMMAGLMEATVAVLLALLAMVELVMIAVVLVMMAALAEATVAVVLPLLMAGLLEPSLQVRIPLSHNPHRS